MAFCTEYLILRRRLWAPSLSMSFWGGGVQPHKSKNYLAIMYRTRRTHSSLCPRNITNWLCWPYVNMYKPSVDTTQEMRAWPFGFRALQVYIPDMSMVISWIVKVEDCWEIFIETCLLPRSSWSSFSQKISGQMTAEEDATGGINTDIEFHNVTWFWFSYKICT